MLQAFLTEELILALHQERVNAGVRAWLVSQARKESSEKKCRNEAAWRIVPLVLRPAHCR
jgi:hypothetical protein